MLCDVRRVSIDAFCVFVDKFYEAIGMIKPSNFLLHVKVQDKFAGFQVNFSTG